MAPHLYCHLSRLLYHLHHLRNFRPHQKECLASTVPAHWRQRTGYEVLWSHLNVSQCRSLKSDCSSITDPAFHLNTERFFNRQWENLNYSGSRLVRWMSS